MSLKEKTTLARVTFLSRSEKDQWPSIPPHIYITMATIQGICALKCLHIKSFLCEKKETRTGDAEDLKLEVSLKLCWIEKHILHWLQLILHRYRNNLYDSVITFYLNDYTLLTKCGL